MDTQNIFEAHISLLTLLIVVSSLNLLTRDYFAGSYLFNWFFGIAMKVLD